MTQAYEIIEVATVEEAVSRGLVVVEEIVRGAERVPVWGYYFHPDAPGRAPDPLDHDGDGEKGGSTPAKPPRLTGRNKAELIAIAEAEGVSANEEMTAAEIVKAIEAKREA